MKDGVKNLIISGRLYKAIRGEEFVFTTPPMINAEMQPTDHNELLSKGIYPLCNEMRADLVLQALESGLRDSATDAIGVYCSIQCYYIQIISENAGESPFKIDRVMLPLFLGEKFRKHEHEFLSIRFNDYDPPDAPLRLTKAAIGSLQRNFGRKFE
jgi:hypothetical protein